MEQKPNSNTEAEVTTSSSHNAKPHVSRRTLKVWNGRGHGKYSQKHISVAAYSKKQAADIISEACECRVSVSEISNYYFPVWGNNMAGVVPTEPSVYVNERFSSTTPIRVYPYGG